MAVLARNGEGTHRLTLQLDPGELGRIAVVIDRRRGSPAAVTVTVERPETLLRLVRDRDGLANALNQAGLAAEDRTLRFQLAPPDARPAPALAAPPGAESRPPPAAFQDGGAFAVTLQQGNPGTGSGAGPENGNGNGGAPPGHDRPAPPRPAPGSDAAGGMPIHALPPARPRRLRGIDITA
ncbi:MAG: flagellar hook-length control protein FliK [Acetobacteraceae bacterium]|nr:flagellar hook-length control protein FliK [Acetobacteraceae bacterium]